MNQTVNFRGASGTAHAFTRTAKDAPWARVPGVAIFAAPDTYGWRVIRVVELTGREHDVRPVWALADAERYGASAVFISMQMDARDRRRMVSDIEMGLSPVVHAANDVMPIAA